MAGKRDYYELLGVARNASEEDVRRAFRRLARQYHPDVNQEPEAEQRIKEINEAYEVLGDAEKRRSYDAYGHAGPRPEGFGGMGGFGGFGGFEDILETFFGSGARPRARRAAVGSDLRYNLSLSFEEAVFGAEKVLEIPRLQTCTRCSGAGAEPGTQRVRCPACGGSGEVRRVQQSILGRFVNVTACDRCRGEGEVISTPCRECRGEGRVRATQRLSVNIPAGIDDQQQIRIAGQGESAPNGGSSGDLYVFVSVAPHPILKRQGSDTLYELSINVAQASLGDEIDVPTLHGTARLRIPSGTQNGKVLRLREQGVPHLRGGGRGDQLVRVRVAVPQDLTDEQRRLLRDLARSFGTPVAGDTGAPAGARNGQAAGLGEKPSAATRSGAAGADGASSGPTRDVPTGHTSSGKGTKRSEDRPKEKGLFEKVKDALTGESDEEDAG